MQYFPFKAAYGSISIVSDNAKSHGKRHSLAASNTKRRHLIISSDSGTHELGDRWEAIPSFPSKYPDRPKELSCCFSQEDEKKEETKTLEEKVKQTLEEEEEEEEAKEQLEEEKQERGHNLGLSRWESLPSSQQKKGLHSSSPPRQPSNPFREPTTRWLPSHR